MRCWWIIVQFLTILLQIKRFKHLEKLKVINTRGFKLLKEGEFVVITYVENKRHYCRWSSRAWPVAFHEQL